jgi:1,4-dihydroxy-2-naphthoyl-CoA synthase
LVQVWLIRLNRPDDGNAIIPEMACELLDVAIRVGKIYYGLHQGRLSSGREGIVAFVAKRTPEFQGK